MGEKKKEEKIEEEGCDHFSPKRAPQPTLRNIQEGSFDEKKKKSERGIVKNSPLALKKV